MKEFTIKANSYLSTDIREYYNCDYGGYQKSGNPDFINHLKNMAMKSSELYLVKDFMAVFERASEDLNSIIKKNNLQECMIVVAPRAKAESHFMRCR